MEVISRQGGLEPGSRVEFKVWMGPLPVRWVAEHVAWEPGRCFVDEARESPFRHWRHEHRMDPESGATRLVDRVELIPPFGWLTETFAPWAVRMQLQRMFEYRHAVIRQWCEDCPSCS